MASDRDTLPVAHRLQDRASWPKWFLQYRINARIKLVWQYVDPDGPTELANYFNAAPPPPTISSIEKKESAEIIAEYEESYNTWLNTPATQRGAPPKQKELPTIETIERKYRLAKLEHKETEERWRADLSRHSSLFTWVQSSVDTDLLLPILTRLERSGNINLQQLVKELRKNHAPAQSLTISTVRQAYRTTLERARSGGIKPGEWLKLWSAAYANAEAYDVVEIKGALGVMDFLGALSYKLAPEWASAELRQARQNETLGKPLLTLKEYGDIFATECHALTLSSTTKLQGAYATIQDHSSSTRQEHNYCPCGKPKHKHPWKPVDCFALQKAINGQADKPFSQSEKQRKAIVQKLESDHFKQLREELKAKGWPKGASKGKGTEKIQYPGSMTATVIDPGLFNQSPTAAIFTTMDFGRHALSESTVLDNCGAMHLVNDPRKLVPGSFQRTTGEAVESGTTAFPISGRGTRVIKNILNGARGPLTEDLTLFDVAVVEGFHVNIVSEALLMKSGIWYIGLDCSLRYGTIAESVVLNKLLRKFNLVFLEYKPITNYSQEIPSSPAGIMMLPMIKRNKAWRPSRDPHRPREDSETLWHARSGHLAPEALRALVSRARNVRINGTPRVKCEHCARAHARKVISRRPSERRSPRPFWRIAWDLFDYVTGFDGSRWLLAIKEEYSGMLFAFPLVNKTQDQIFAKLREFESWVRRQYRLAICNIRQDNDTGVIAINGKSAYQIWAQEEGINLETTPSHTKEPNGGAERAGQEIITKAIKMLAGAGIPRDLWPEAVRAAAYLYNISPNVRNELRSPIEKLETWFRNYFRWYTPEIVRELTSDLRPDWSGIYAYGCRAYPLNKRREAGLDRRAFKVKERAHIGYLVGYESTNIFRIWIPQLHVVITTRNVTFDEELFYDSPEERQAQPVAVIEELLPALEEKEITTSKDSILEMLDSWDEKEQGKDVHHDSEHLESTSEAQESGVEGTTKIPATGHSGQASGSARTGLLTPRETPEAQEMLSQAPMEQENGDEPSEILDEIKVATPDQRSISESDALSTRDQGEILDEIVVSIPEHPEPENIQPDVRSELPRPDRDVHSTGENMGTEVSRAAPQRSSRRLKGEDPEWSGGIYTTMSLDHGGSSEIEDPRWRSFIGTFLPQMELGKHIVEDRQHKALHAVIAAAVHQSSANRLSAAPSKDRIHRDELIKPPKAWRDLANHPFKERFEEAARVEVDTLEKMDAWRVIERSAATTRPLPLKWVFTYKFDEDGYLERCKARICVRGDLQNDSLMSTYSATLAAGSLRTILAMAAHQNLEIKQYDVIGAFLNASRKGHEQIACELPDGFKKLGKCVVLDKALYGLRDSPLLWFQEFSSTLKGMGLIRSAEEPCVFYTVDRKVIILFYVDDFLMLFRKADEKIAEDLVRKIKAVYDLKSQGDVAWFLGIRILRNRTLQTITLIHDSYIEKIAMKYNLADNSWTPHTPLPGKELSKYEGEASKAQIKAYQERVGSILYTAIMIRPDVAYAASALSHYLTNPGPEHLETADRVIRYLYGTRHLGIRYGGRISGTQVLMIAGDASFADDPETRRSSHGYIISLYGGAILWKAARQSTVTTSTTEAELLALGLTARESMALKRFCRDLAMDLGKCWKIFCDNQQTIRLVVGENERINSRLRHVDLQNMWLRQEQSRGSFEVAYLPTDQMPADGLTKNLTRQQFEHFRALLNLHDARSMIEHGDRKTPNAQIYCPKAHDYLPEGPKKLPARRRSPKTSSPSSPTS